MAGAAPARSAPGRTAAATSSGLANRGLGGHARRPNHVRFPYGAGVVCLHCGIVHCAIFQLPRRDGLVESNARAIAVVSSCSRNAEKSVGRFPCRRRRHFHRLATEPVPALAEILAPTLTNLFPEPQRAK